MWEQSTVLIVAVAVGVPCLGWILVSIAESWRKVRVSEHQAALKQTMVERGMSAEEIERVIKVGAPIEEHPAKGT